MTLSTLPPMRVPTLTEVVEWPETVRPEPAPPPASGDDELPVLSEALPESWSQAEAEAVGSMPCSAAAAAPVSVPEPIDEAALTRRILADVQRQVDRMFEQRLQSSLAPMLEQLSQTLALQTRDQLALTLRDVVAEAVLHELARHRGELDGVETD